MNGGKEYLVAHQERVGLLLEQLCEGNGDIVKIASIQNQQAQAKSIRGNLRFSRFSLGRYGVFRIDEQCNRGRSRHQLM